jgi:hypothetical protein
MAKKEKNAKRNIVFIFELSVIIAFFLFLLTGGLNGIGKQLGAFFNSQQSTIKSIDKVNQSKSSDESKAEKDTTVFTAITFSKSKTTGNGSSGPLGTCYIKPYSITWF